MNNYNELLQKIKNTHYPELKDIQIKLKPLKILKKVFMVTLPFSNNIYYNKDVILNCNEPALKAVLMHELYHIIQFKKLNILQKIFFIPKYHLNYNYRRKHELVAHVEVVRSGFKEELLELNNFVMSRYPKDVWKKKLSKYYLTENEINTIENNKKDKKYC